MKNTIQQFINQGGKDVLKELENKNIIEEIIIDFKGKTFSDNNDVINWLRSSLQKAINAEKERCLGCVPEERKDDIDELDYTDEANFRRIGNAYVNSFRQEVINKINN